MIPRLIFANSETSADLYYATGFFAPDPFLYLRDSTATSHLVTSVLEVDRARRTARVDRIDEWGAIVTRYRAKKGANATPTLAEQMAFFLKEQNIQRVQVPEEFPVQLADDLRRLAIIISPVRGSFWPERIWKRTDEIAALRAALRITAQGMSAGIETIRAASIGPDGLLLLDNAPLTSERVRSAIHTTLIQAGAVPHRTIVAGGFQAADPHEMGSGPLYAHQAIILDVFPRIEATGYWGDMSRTVCRGTPPERIQQAWNAVLAGQEVAFAQIRHGASGKAIHDAVTHSMTAAGFPTAPMADGRQGGFFHGTGHGLGLEIHEAPRISSRDFTLETNHVVTVEPGLYYPDMGGVRLEDVVVVEEEGCQNLTEMAKFLEL